MTALLAKDLRLSADVLRPWMLIVAGFVLAATVVLRMPNELLPEALQRFTMADLFGLVAFGAAASGLVLAAWTVAAVIQGDRGHGAELLHASLPVSGWRRAGSKAAAMVIVAAVPVVVAIGSSLVSRWLRPAPGLVTPASTVQIAWIAALAGAGFAVPASQLLRGSFRTVLMVLAVAFVAVAGAALGAWAVTHWFGRLVATTLQASQSGWPLVLATERAAAAGLVVGLSGAAIVSGVAGITCIAQPPARKRAMVVLVGAPLLAGVLGALAARVALARDHAFWDSSVGQALIARQASDQVVAAQMHAWLSRQWEPGSSTTTIPPSSWAYVYEGQQRMRATSPDQRLNNPIMQELLAFQDHSTYELAIGSISLLPHGDHTRRAAALDDTLRFPDEVVFRWMLAAELAAMPGAPPAYRPVRPIDPVIKPAAAAAASRDANASLLRQLEWARDHADLDPIEIDRAIELLRKE